MRRFVLYTDASFDERKSLGVHSFVVLKSNGNVFRWDTVAAKCKNTFQAEMAGLLAGLETLPDKSAVVAHTDIRAFSEIYANGYQSKHACIRKLRRVIDDKQLHFAFEYERVKGLRSLWYQLCHHRANLTLRSLVGRGGKMLGER